MKFLIVGLGSMGKRRVRNLKYLKAGEIFGFDPREDRRQEVTEKYGIETFDNVEIAFDRKPDAVVISTPPDLHIPYAVQAARRGLHFFTEASVVDTGIEDLLEICRQNPDIVAVPSCTMRYFPGPKKILEVVQDGIVGRPLTFTLHTGQYLPDWHPWEDYRTFYVSQRSTGACREIVPFEMTWLCKVFGEVASVFGKKGKTSDLEADIDDFYQILLDFDSGVSGFLQVDVLARDFLRHFRLIGSEGTVEWDCQGNEVRVFEAATGKWAVHSLELGTAEKMYVNPEEPYVAEMRDFIAAMKGERSFGYTYEEDCRILSCLYASERSHGEGRRITLKGERDFGFIDDTSDPSAPWNSEDSQEIEAVANLR